MEILVCARRVPDTSENEIELNAAGNDIERDELVYSVNEADNYAVEEALEIRDRVGGKVTVVTVDNEEGEEILRRPLAMVQIKPFCSPTTASRVLTEKVSPPSSRPL